MQRTGSELDTERLSCTQNRVADRYTGRLLVHLDRSLVCIDPDDLCAHLARI